jgi:hypothetical protein
MADGMQRDWRELCVAVTNERDSTKLTSLVQELIEALERGERSWRHPIPPSVPIATNWEAAREPLSWLSTGYELRLYSPSNVPDQHRNRQPSYSGTHKAPSMCCSGAQIARLSKRKRSLPIFHAALPVACAPSPSSSVPSSEECS